MSRSMLATLAIPLALIAVSCGDDSGTSSADTGGTAATAAPDPYGGTVTTPDTGTPDAGTGEVLALVSTDLGDVLAGPNGHTVYLFEPDAQGDSTCSTGCIEAWPFVPEVAGVGDGLDASLLGTTTRDDGSVQATYNGWPMYYFGGDQAPGDVNGQDIGGVWYVVGATGDAVES